MYSLATPLYGLTFGLSILAIGIGAVLYQKKFIPEEIAVQDRHDGPSSEVDRKTIVAELGETLDASTIKRRKLIGVSLGLGLGAFGLSTVVAFVGGLIKNPWKPVVPTSKGPTAVLWTSGWTPRFEGETIFLARSTGKSGETPNVLLKIRPEDIDAGGMETVFPWRESDGDGTTVESHEKISEIMMGIRNPVMLIRIKPNDVQQGGETSRAGKLQLRRPVRVHQDLLAPGLPGLAVRAADLPHPVPVPPVAVRPPALRQADLRSGGKSVGAVANYD